MKIAQKIERLNRRATVDAVTGGLGLTVIDRFTTAHDSLGTDAMILRKGAVSAKKGERLLVPINMRDGSLVCEGKGNRDGGRAPHAPSTTSRQRGTDGASPRTARAIKKARPSRGAPFRVVTIAMAGILPDDTDRHADGVSV